ncbi:MalY/PatB family protein [Chitinimonas lacunae]|uniref:Putative 8-amino-7-oxononanoate synthase n=1 Tax=Chitinimonas lacunae TaxID=1963018 RepID=A0ABV8MLP7_9NEIS
MEFDFDRPIPRHDSDSMKWGRYRGRDILALWQADMDFRTAPVIEAALAKRLEHGILGYGEATAPVEQAVVDHLAARHDWQIDRTQLLWLPGLVPALYLACRAFAQPGQGILTATPVYPHLLSAPPSAGCRLIGLPLREPDWDWDLDALRSAITADTRLLLLCHPHNPVGRRWDLPTLTALARLVEQYDLTVVSDEVHCELQLDAGARHRPFATLPGMAQRTITLMSASKTYNLAGLQCAFAIISNPALKETLLRTGYGLLPPPNPLGLTATEAALRGGAPWLAALLDYLRGNRDRVHAALDGVAGLRVNRPQATYLSWLDCRALPHPHPRELFEEAGVGLSDGSEFGLPGFARLNFACPRVTLEQALERMQGKLRSFE